MLNHVFNDISEQGEQAASNWLQGSVESTHKVPTSHYHTKHEHLAKRSAQKTELKTERHTTAVLYTLTVGLTVHVMNRFKPGASCVIRVSVCPVCVFCVSRPPPMSFYRYHLGCPLHVQSIVACTPRLHSKLETQTAVASLGGQHTGGDLAKRSVELGTLTTGPLIDSCAKRSALNDSGARTSERAPKRLPKRPRSRRSR